jgi:hypothetical protein
VHKDPVGPRHAVRSLAARRCPMWFWVFIVVLGVALAALAFTDARRRRR